MSWAAYAFINEDRSDCTQASKGEIAGWESVVRQSLRLIASEGDSLFAIVSDAAEIQFCETKELDATAGFPRGRIFGPLGELRWRPWCRGRHLVLVTDAEADLASLQEIGFEDATALDLLVEEPVPSLLWGELESDGQWRDGRIPRDLAYPIDHGKEGQTAWLSVKRYVDDAGVTQFTRCVGVIGERRASL